MTRVILITFVMVVVITVVRIVAAEGSQEVSLIGELAHRRAFIVRVKFTIITV